MPQATAAETSIHTRTLINRLNDARDETDRVFTLVKPAFLYERPIPERHRIVFYLGHLEAFDWNLLRPVLHLEPFDTQFDKLFAFGIDPVDGQNPSDVPADWPSVSAVMSYVKRVRDALDQNWDRAPRSAEFAHLLNIAVEHRLMHAETLEYMLHQLPYAAKVPQHQTMVETNAPQPEMREVPAGTVKLGFDAKFGDFGWDNEFEPQSISVPAFSIDKYKVTNREFLQFWEAGGYHKREFWSESDWKWKERVRIVHPAFWRPSKDGFIYRSMFEDRPLPLHAPVFVSHAEASAYANWAGKSLPSEEEWQRAAEGAGTPINTRILWDPPPVTSPIAKPSRLGVHGLIGTGWEWTSSQFAPFPGFAASAAYPGYSANFFDGLHYVLKGGSTRTAACMLRKSFRNWFQPHYQYIYSGFRCVRRG